MVESIEIIRGYKVLGVLGKGGFGLVKKVECCLTKNIYALKEIHLDNPDDIELIVNEMQLSIRLDHGNLVKAKEYFQDKNNLYIVMEYCDGGDLQELIQSAKTKKTPFEEKKIGQIFLRLCKGVRYLHNLNILHRDLKPKNVFLLKDGNVKVGDLGLAKVLEESAHAKTQLGTLLYYSPEVANGKAYNNKSDIWALGCILYEMLTLEKVYDPRDKDLISKIMKGETIPIPNEVLMSSSIGLITLIQKMLTIDQTKRADIKDVIESDFLILFNEIENYDDDVDENIVKQEIKKLVEKNNNPIPKVEPKINGPGNLIFNSKNVDIFNPEFISALYKNSGANEDTIEELNSGLSLIKEIQKADSAKPKKSKEEFKASLDFARQFLNGDYEKELKKQQHEESKKDYIESIRRYEEHFGIPATELREKYKDMFEK